MAEVSPFIARLSALAAADPLREKILLAPSYRVGRQWLDQAATLAGGLANVRAVPLQRFMLDCAQPGLETKKLRPAGQEEKIRLMCLALEAVSSGSAGAGYFTRLPASLNLARTLLASIEELEDAGTVNPVVLTRKIASRDKAGELSGLLERYRHGRRREGLAGRAEICAAALKFVERHRNALPLLMLPESVAETALTTERRFLDSWPGERMEAIPEDADTIPEAMEFFQAAGEADEIREVFRRIQQAGRPLDTVEIVCLDTVSHVPLVCSAALECFGGRVEDLPISVNAGLPGFYAKPVRLLTAWLDWLEDDLPPSGLADMIESGLIPEGWRAVAPGIGASRLAARLKVLPITPGFGEYLSTLGKSGADTGMREAENWLARWLLETVPLANGGAAADLRDAAVVLRAAEGLLRGTGGDGKFDAYARAALLDAVAAWKIVADRPAFDGVEWLRALSRDLMVMGLGPLPGKLHVSDIFSGGNSGREAMFLVGCDDSRFPGGGRQDPVLLDGERRAISRRLPSSHERRRRRERAMARLLARLRGRVVVSHARRSAVDGRELFPSVLYSRLRGEAAKPEPLAVLRPDVAEACLSVRDDWLLAVLGEPRNTLTPGDLAPWHPNLAAGWTAANARASDSFTEWDGNVPEAGEAYRRENWVLSPSQLEFLARCPLDFFFRRALGVKPPDRHEFVPGRWLAGNERGELLHEVFQEFMTGYVAAGEGVPEEAADRERRRLTGLLEEAIRKIRRRNPPRDRLAYERDRRALYDACVIFLFREMERSRRGRALCLEAALGGAEENRPPWFREEPVLLDMRGGGRVALQGRVDRIDRLHGAGGLVIWDYKTGRSGDFSRQNPFNEGRHLQPLLYTEMLEAATREAGMPEPVAEFSYFFPMQRDEGNVITYTRAELRGGMAIVETLVAMLAAGRFPLTVDKRDLRYSDYASVYGDVAALCAAARRKAASDPALRDWAALRGIAGTEDPNLQ